MAAAVELLVAVVTAMVAAEMTAAAGAGVGELHPVRAAEMTTAVTAALKADSSALSRYSPASISCRADDSSTVRSAPAR